MHLGQRETIVGCAVADFLANKGREGELEQLPAAEVVDKGHGKPFRIVRGRAWITVVQYVDKQCCA